MKNILSFFTLILLMGCTPQKKDAEKTSIIEPYVLPAHHTEALTKVFNAHGGYERWSQMKSLSYQKGEEYTITNLQNRKIRLASPDQTIGFDGSKVWMFPDSLDATRARFYHNLYFYFYAMPFVVGDPGAIYEVLEPREINGETFNGVKISYNEGVGDAPDDNYIIWSDPDTNEMKWLMYTVTYRSGESSDRYSLIKYPDWKDVRGLRLPAKLQWYHYENDSIGDLRSEALFENVELSEKVPDSTLFSMPENAQIAPR